MPTHYTWTLLLLFVVALAPASAKQERLRDELITVLQSDAEMQTAIAKAREGLAAFWEVFSQRKNGDASDASARTTERDHAGNFLTNLLQPKAGKVLTTIGGEAKSVNSLRLGEWIDAVAADVQSWLQPRASTVAFGDLLRRFSPRKPLAEIEWVRQFLAVP